MRAILENVVGRLHVSSSNLEVIRAVRKALKPAARRSPALKATRKAAYRTALEIHEENRDFYLAVTSGTL